MALDAVAVATAVLVLDDVAGLGEVIDDSERSALGNAEHVGDLAQADAGIPLVFADPDDPAAQAIEHGARGLVALTPVELPMMAMPAGPPQPTGISLPMA